MKLGIELVQDFLGENAAVEDTTKKIIETPVCQTADTLCQLNEYIKTQGYDIPKLVADKTGYDVVPTHLPQVAQDGLLKLEEHTGISPVQASIGGVVSLFAIGSMIASYALYKRLSRECPAPIFAVIKDNEAWMAIYDTLPERAQAALKQLDTAAVREMFECWNNPGVNDSKTTLGAQFAKSKEATQFAVLESKMHGKKLDMSKLNKDVQKAQLKKVADVKKPGAQSDASTTASSSTTAPTATWSYSDYIPSPINGTKRLIGWAYNMCPTIRKSTVVAPTQTATTEVDVKATTKASL